MTIIFVERIIMEVPIAMLRAVVMRIFSIVIDKMLWKKRIILLNQEGERY